MARRPITKLVDLCDEVGVEHLQVTEVLRRIHDTVMDGNDVIVQEFGTFYKRVSRPRIRVLNGVRHLAPRRETVALRPPRFPAELADPLLCDDFEELVTVLPEGGFSERRQFPTVLNLNGADFNITATIDVQFILVVRCEPTPEGRKLRASVRGAGFLAHNAGSIQPVTGTVETEFLGEVRSQQITPPNFSSDSFGIESQLVDLRSVLEPTPFIVRITFGSRTATFSQELVAVNDFRLDSAESIL